LLRPRSVAASLIALLCLPRRSPVLRALRFTRSVKT
jgi:hypothetical protein